MLLPSCGTLCVVLLKTLRGAEPSVQVTLGAVPYLALCCSLLVVPFICKQQDSEASTSRARSCSVQRKWVSPSKGKLPNFTTIRTRFRCQDDLLQVFPIWIFSSCSPHSFLRQHQLHFGLLQSLKAQFPSWCLCYMIETAGTDSSKGSSSPHLVSSLNLCFQLQP